LETNEYSVNIFNSFYFNNLSPIFLPLLIIAALILLLALVSTTGAEVAFLSISNSYKAYFEKDQTKKAKTLARLLTDPERLIATLVVANVFLKIAFFVISFYAAISLFHSVILASWSTVVICILSILLIMLCSELIPKVYAVTEPKKYLLGITYWIYFLQKIFAPVSVAFCKIIIAFNQKFISKSGQISVDELTEAIEQASDSYTDEEDILKGIVKFGNIDVSQILRPRIDVVSVDYKMAIKQVLEIVVDSEYSRLPVYAGSFDHVKGILFVKDLLPFINEKDNFRWQSLIRPPYFVPDTKKVKKLLPEFHTRKIHMAVIVDEYGGTLGIVTLEDILEEIVGEISDESDEDEKSYSQINDNTYIFDGKTLLNDFYKILQTETTVFEDIKGDADTLAGLILELKGEIPKKNEQIKYKQFIFKIEAVDSRRIKQIRITIPAGIENGQTIKIAGHGGQGINGGPNGDLYITFLIANHTEFKRSGNDLYKKIDLDLYKAVLGGEITIDTLTGKVKLKVKPETQNETKIKLKGKGFPVYKNEGQFGDLYVTYFIKIPTNLTDKQKELFNELSKS